MSVKIFKLGGSGDLSGYVPYTGATQDVDLGLFGLQADSIGIGTTPDAQALFHAINGVLYNTTTDFVQAIGL